MMRRAFTYLEILIAISIMAIIATLLAPMGGMAGAGQLRAAARMLVADLQFAQLESTVHGDDRRIVVIDGSSRGYWLATESAPRMPITNPADGEPFVVRYGTGRAVLLPDVTIAGHALDGDDRLGFGIYGELDQLAPASIVLEALGSSLTITLDPSTGEASIGQLR